MIPSSLTRLAGRALLEGAVEPVLAAGLSAMVALQRAVFVLDADRRLLHVEYMDDQWRSSGQSRTPRDHLARPTQFDGLGSTATERG